MQTVCGTCKWFSTHQQGRERTTVCRGDYPKATLVPVQTLQGQGLQLVTLWPQVTDADFCGRHETKFATDNAH